MHLISTSIDTFNSSLYWFEQNKLTSAVTQPLAAGSHAPHFSLHLHEGIWQEIPAQTVQAGQVTLEQLLNYRPLVLSFYTPHAKSYSHQQLNTLINTYPKIRALGGELLVLTAESIEGIHRIADYYQLPFNIARDAGNRIASRFGLYSVANPVWQRIAGLDEEVSLPSTYVIAPHGQITYAFADTDFNQELPVRSLLSAVYKLADNQIRKVA